MRLLGPQDAGWKSSSYAGYAVDWAFEHSRANDAHALCASWPVGLEPLQLAHWPVAAEGEAMGIEAEVLDHLRPSLLARARDLADLR